MEAADLFLAYVRRQRFEARILAREVAAVLSGDAPTATLPTAVGAKAANRIHADRMLRECGVTL
jgi:hypothetical protein